MKATRMQAVYDGVGQLSGSRRRWVSKYDVVEALGDGERVSPFLSHLVAAGLIEMRPGAGTGQDGRRCSGYRQASAKAKPSGIDEALVALQEIKERLHHVVAILQTAA